MFAGHAAFRFKQDPFYSNNFAPTVKQLVDRILTGAMKRAGRPAARAGCAPRPRPRRTSTALLGFDRPARR